MSRLLTGALAVMLAMILSVSLWSAALSAQEANGSAAPVEAEESSEVVLSAEVPGVDMAAWEAVARRSETALDSGDVSTAVLETLRSQVALYRQQFLDAQSLNDARIATLRSQIAALGTPEEGVEEAPPVAARRAELEAQLARATAPVLAAEEAYTRANGIVAEIDTIARERQADRLLELGPSPLNPTHWGPALTALARSWTPIGRELGVSLSLDTRRAALFNQAPLVLMYLALAVVLLLRGRTWARRASRWVLTRSARGGRILNSLLSIGQIALPLLGIWALVQAIEATNLLGVRGALLLEWLPFLAIVMFGVHWLADRLFSEHEGDRMLPMARLHRQEARFYAALFGFTAVARGLTESMGAFDNYRAETVAVIDFPFIVLTALILYRVGQLLRKKVVFEETEETPAPMRARIIRLLGRAACVIAVVGPVLAATGYGAAARALVYPAVTTLLVGGLVLVLQRFTSDLYRFVARQSDDEEDSLITVLIGFVLTLAALPVLALVWGARVADLTELWTRFREGFAVGETRIQPTDFLVFILIFVLLYSATRLLQASLRNTVLPKTRLDTGGQNAVVSGVGYIGIFLSALVAISATGLDLSSLAIVAGALSVGIGFGLQNIVSNFVSGIILLIERPIAEGDWIEVGGNMGYVRGISVRSTRIQTFDRTDVIVPNADLISGTVTNYTRGNTIGRVIVPVGVAYGTDTRRVESILLSIARQHDMVLLNPEPSVVFQGFGADSLDFEIRAILRDVNYVLAVKSDMNHQIAEKFVEEGIEIPFAQRDIWIRNPEAITPAKPDAEDDRRPDAAPTQVAEMSRDMPEIDELDGGETA